jgi:hypothetical protein
MSSLDTSFIHTQLNIPGLIGIIVFYGIVFGVGIFASFRRRHAKKSSDSEDVMLASRNMNEVIGVFTLAGMLSCGISKLYKYSHMVTNREQMSDEKVS